MVVTAIDLDLPAQYNSPATLQEARDYFNDLLSFLTAPLPLSILSSHPNEVALETFVVPNEWNEWWEWASSKDVSTTWKSVVTICYSDVDPSRYSLKIPQTLHMMSTLRRLLLPRGSTLPVDSQAHARTFLIKPKKSVQVASLAPLIGSIAETVQAQQVVDVGAGQAYLTKALASPPYSLRLLALEGSGAQLEGEKTKAKKRQQASQSNRKQRNEIPNLDLDITYKELRVDRSNLAAAISDWMTACANPQVNENVVLVGLHTCGELTPSIIRTFLSCLRNSHQSNWTPVGLAVVGCCYHLMEEDSKNCETVLKPLNYSIRHDHLMLSVQTPHMWALNGKSSHSADLALRKVAYRAYLERLVRGNSTLKGKKSTGRVYRMQDRFCGSFDEYVQEAARRLGIDDCVDLAAVVLSSRLGTEAESDLLLKLTVLHTLRCMLGPLVEAVILLDRFFALVEGCEDCSIPVIVRMRNVFNEVDGGPRNMALLVERHSAISKFL